MMKLLNYKALNSECEQSHENNIYHTAFTEADPP